MEQRTTPTRRSEPAARILAVFALLVAVLVVVVVVAGSLGGGSGGASSTTGSSTSSHPPPTQRFYVVKPGDSLSNIHLRFHVPVAVLERLNPNLDPQNLPAQGCVNLVPDGCKALSGG